MADKEPKKDDKSKDKDKSKEKDSKKDSKDDDKSGKTPPKKKEESDKKDSDKKDGAPPPAPEQQEPEQLPKPSKGKTAVGTPADKIEMNPMQDTDLANASFVREHIDGWFVEAFPSDHDEERKQFDADGREVPRNKGMYLGAKNGLRSDTLRYWIARAKRQQVQQKIIDDS